LREWRSDDKTSEQMVTKTPKQPFAASNAKVY
jgi:hypothetical protein